VVELSQSVETEIADSLRAQLPTVVTELPLNAINDEGEAAGVDVSFVAGPVEAAEQLLSIERLAGAVALDHLERLGDGTLIGGEAVAAACALAAAADGSVRHAPGLERLGGGVAAGTVHSSECTEP
jgi:hypothetical protein